MKKLYNNTLLQLILALCTFSFVACQEFEDVYKRQSGNMPQTDPDYDKTHIFVPSGSDTPLTYSESSGPVSYTHLDVYKSKPPVCWDIRMPVPT